MFLFLRLIVAITSRSLAMDAVYLFIKANPYKTIKINYYEEMLYSVEVIAFVNIFSLGKYAAIKKEYFETLKPYVDKLSMERK